MALQVTVDQGTLQGKECVTPDGYKYFSFEGIPFAQPPVGDLRFKDPLPPLKWSGIRDATKPGNRSVQLKPTKTGEFAGSEDCLYLNVYTPVLPAEKLKNLPVLFYIYGGRLVIGYSDYYRPDYFIRHDVIVVTCNYRLHVLGFLCLDLPEVPGNAGMKDCVMALKWVNRNIMNFNGDPLNVTVFGESAGGAITASLVTSGMSDGLLHKMICVSGTSISDLFMNEDDPLDKAKHIASIMGFKTTDKRELYEFLKNAPLNDLVFATAVAEMSRPTELHAYLLPVVEKRFEGVKRFFEEYPFVSVMNGRVKKVPLLCGYNSHEGGYFLQKDDKGNVLYHKNLKQILPRYLFLDKNSQQANQLGKNIQEFYFKGKPINDSTKEIYLNLTSDVYFKNDINYFVELYMKYVKDVYMYKFSYSGSINTPVMKSINIKGASHGDIIQYLFYREAKAKKCTDEDRKIIDFLSESWCNFMKYGKPTTTSSTPIEWLPYEKNKRRIALIDSEIKMVENLDLDNVMFWKQILSGGRHKL